MAHWNAPESGILRKRKKDNDIEKLLVFGYACKLFKDDEKALHIDQGKHLIPWMGDERLKIDRYDCRGHLSDLSQYEASHQDYDTARWLGLDENERKLEQLCDEERYYSLLNNEEEEEMYKEEELKRNKTNEFQYSYDVPTNPDEEKNVPTVPEYDIEQKYVPSPDLDVPVDIEIPKTEREYIRIEKTAIFVSTQGPQMEILIKAKQSDNPQFSFLNQNDCLYKFYRHVLDAVRNRRYRSNATKADDITSNTSVGENDDHYLHPSLVSSFAPSADVRHTVPSIPYRPNANCAYSQLVSKIQGATNTDGNIHSTTQDKAPADDQNSEKGAHLDLNSLTLEQQQQYYQYYMQRQYYEYYKQFVDKSGTSGDISSQAELSLDPNMQALVQQMMYAQYFQQIQAQQPQQQSTNPYAQIVSNLCKEIPSSNSVATNEKSDIAKDPIIYSNGKNATPDVSLIQTENYIDAKVNCQTRVSTVSPKKAALSLIQNYASDSEEEAYVVETKVENDFKIPDEDTKLVIDKMASYVVKNGEDFEKIVKSRNDPRFLFLNEDHEYYQYYCQKVDEERKKITCCDSQKEEKTISIEESSVNAGKIKEKKTIAPVSFSIKKAREDHPKEIKSALPVDEETDEEETANQDTAPLGPVIPQPPTLVTSSTSKNLNRTETSLKPKAKEFQPNITSDNNQAETQVKPIETNELVEKEPSIMEIKDCDEKPVEQTKLRSKKNNILIEDDPILEMIDLTEDGKKIDLVKDGDIFDLSSEKETTAKVTRALQLERRKKAMAFLKLKTGVQDTDQIPENGKPLILTIDLANIESPQKKYSSSDSSDEDEKKRRRKKRSRSRNLEIDNNKNKTSKESERIAHRRNKKHEKAQSSKRDESNDSIISDKEEGQMSDDSDDAKHKRSSHKKKKSHKRKHSRSKISSKSKKKLRRRASSHSDSD